jgi:hypothetical protein
MGLFQLLFEASCNVSHPTCTSEMFVAHAFDTKCKAMLVALVTKLQRRMKRDNQEEKRNLDVAQIERAPLTSLY